MTSVRVSRPAGLQDKLRDLHIGDDVSITFIDVLFGLVARQIFTDMFSLTGEQTATGVNLGLALVLVSFSWVGYHSSKKSTPRGGFHFDDLTLLSFVIDLAIVGAYYALVKQIEHSQTLQSAHRGIQLHPEQLTILIVFGLYVLWDLTEIAIAATVQELRPVSGDLIRTRTQHFARSVLFLALMASVSGLAAWVWEPATTTKLIGLDVVYALLLFAYRFSQEEVDVQPPMASVQEAPTV